MEQVAKRAASEILAANKQCFGLVAVYHKHHLSLIMYMYMYASTFIFIHVPLEV